MVGPKGPYLPPGDLVLHIGKKVPKTGQIFTLYQCFNIAFLNGTCGPDWAWVFKWHLKMKTWLNLFVQSPKFPVPDYTVGCQYCIFIFGGSRGLIF